MPRETKADKARRLLAEGRLTIVRVDPERRVIVARCKGDSGEEYTLGYDPRGNGRWGCTCPGRAKCSHLLALQLVTVTRPRR